MKEFKHLLITLAILSLCFTSYPQSLTSTMLLADTKIVQLQGAEKLNDRSVLPYMRIKQFFWQRSKWAVFVPARDGNAKIDTPLHTTLYQGRDLDPETGLYYYRARYYSPDLGRFISHDPLNYVDGMNMYEFVRGNPLMYTDPYGTVAGLEEVADVLDKAIDSVVDAVSITDELDAKSDVDKTTGDNIKEGVAIATETVASVGGIVAKGASDLLRVGEGTKESAEQLANAKNLGEAVGATKGFFTDVLRVTGIAGIAENLVGRSAAKASASKLADDVAVKGESIVDDVVSPSIGQKSVGAAQTDEAVLNNVKNRLDGESLTDKVVNDNISDVANNSETILYQKLGPNDEHLKFGITKNPAIRYTKEQLGGGKLVEIARGNKKEMLALERNVHDTLPIGPEEAQSFYIKKQVEKGLNPPPYGD